MWINCGTHNPYPGAGPSDPSEFRRFLNLRIRCSASRAMRAQFIVPSLLRTFSADWVFPSLAPPISASAVDPNRISSGYTTA